MTDDSTALQLEQTASPWISPPSSTPNTAPAIEAEVGKVIVGQRELVRTVLMCLLCEGHALLEGVPGLGKTLLLKTLSQVVDLAFGRIQFTPDLMPADIVGTQVLEEDERRPPRVPVPAGAGVRQPRARRRGQPGHAEDPVGAARGDAGAHASPWPARPGRCPGRSS